MKGSGDSTSFLYSYIMKVGIIICFKYKFELNIKFKRISCQPIRNL